jgi:hypothetical protein
VLNRLGGSTGTAAFTIALQHALAGAGPSAAASAAAYGTAFRWVLGAALLMAVPALLLARAESRPRSGGQPQTEQSPTAAPASADTANR